ncbi:MAG: anaerobic ribonucleoside-triphosphate reductase activating protein [Clostridia bacterium]|nr:anaerobic ribonucleoside-triphosphate reductase activating protein [Clostridia bacterium]
MNIAGFQKTSFVDYPNVIASVIFTKGCNMRCAYCHNKHILSADAPTVSESDVLEYLLKRKDMIKGVVITGGEPTLQGDLLEFIQRIKAFGFKIKLDTNGLNIDVLKKVCNSKLVDYIAMDVKASLDKYSDVCGVKIDIERIKESIKVIKESGIEHEFRTTFCPELTKEDVVEISNMIDGSDFYLQQYRQVEGGREPHLPSYVNETADMILQSGRKCVVRGL